MFGVTFIVMLNVVKLSVIMLSDVLLSDFMLSVVLRVIIHVWRMYDKSSHELS
jgi:hypothetical protein